MVYIVLVNWNGWRDTLECLESLFKLEDADYTVVVCDNASEDGSIQQIKLWAEGALTAEAVDPRYEPRLYPRLPKPLPYVELGPENSVEAAGSARLVLIPMGENKGFAGGCNLGMRFALDRGDAEFIWLLNNDTVVEREALSHLVAKMKKEPKIGLCGSTLRYYTSPETVQCYGGYRFNEWIARVLPMRGERDSNGAPLESEIEANLKFISGASTLVRRDLLEKVGLMNEQYFLYFEEIDWAVRTRGLYSLGYCRDSIVYHKEGRSIGSHRSSVKRSLFSEACLSRNRVLFTHTYFPARIPIVMAWVTLVSFQRMLCGRYALGRTMLTSAWKGLLKSPRKVKPAHVSGP
jgi:GT2 family glycosyltransferase